MFRRNELAPPSPRAFMKLQGYQHSDDGGSMIHQKVVNNLTGCINGVTVHMITLYSLPWDSIAAQGARLQLPILFLLAISDFFFTLITFCVRDYDVPSWLYGSNESFLQFLGNMQFLQVWGGKVFLISSHRRTDRQTDWRRGNHLHNQILRNLLNL